MLKTERMDGYKFAAAEVEFYIVDRNSVETLSLLKIAD